MTNTWIAVNPLTDEVLKEFRSVDFDMTELYDEFGVPIDVFDKTDGMRFLGSIAVDDEGPLCIPDTFPIRGRR
jgi:hypothetical protein